MDFEIEKTICGIVGPEIVRVPLVDQRAVAQHQEAVGLGLAQHLIDAAPSGRRFGITKSSSKGFARVGSVGIIATGTSSDTWWKAQRFHGERRQLASVTVSVVSMILPDSDFFN